MTTLAETELAIQQLPAADLAVLRDWFAEYGIAFWDRQLEADAISGKLDELANETYLKYLNLDVVLQL